MLETIIGPLAIAAIVAVAASIVAQKAADARMNGYKHRIEALERELQSVRDRLHDWAPHIGWVDQERRGGRQ